MDNFSLTMEEIAEATQLRAEQIQQMVAPHSKVEKELDVNFVLQCLEYNRVGDATLFCTLFAKKYVYVYEWDKWLLWTGNNWDFDPINKSAMADVERVCETYQKAVESKGVDEDSYLNKSLQKRLKVLRSHTGRKEVLLCATTIDNPLVISSAQIDQQPHLLATPSGVVDLRTGDFSAGKQEQYILNTTPTPWTGMDTHCPHFMEYLTSCMNGDKEMVNFLIRLLGYGLLGEKHLHVWAIMYGPLSRNGKDTLMNVVKKILGNRLHVRINVSMLVEQKFPRDSSQPSADLMALRGSRIAYASEANSTQKLDQTKLKDMTGGGFITARGINDKGMTEWTQSALIMLLTNYLPKIDFDDEGFRARTICVEWPVKFVAEPKKEYERQIDYNMAKKLESESSGILAAMVRGAIEVNQKGLQIPEKVLKYTQDQIDSFDDIGKFIKECCIVEEPPIGGRDYQTRSPSSELLKICNWWCKKTLGNSYPYSPKKFTPALEKKGIFTRKSSIMYYMGIIVSSEILQEFEADNENQDKGGRK